MAEELLVLSSWRYHHLLAPAAPAAQALNAAAAESCEEPAKAPRKKLAAQRTTGSAKPQFTHFFALRIDPGHIGPACVAWQEELVKATPELSKCVIKPQKFHLTLGLLALPAVEAAEAAGGDDVDEAAAAELARATEALRAGAAIVRGPLAVHFPGLGSFREDVLFARCEDDPKTGSPGALAALAAAAKAELEARAFAHQPSFAAHVTIAKTSKWRPPKKKTGKPKRPKIAKDLWHHAREEPLSHEPYRFESLDLLRMLGDDGDGGYPVVASAAFEATPTETPLPSDELEAPPGPPSTSPARKQSSPRQSRRRRR